VAVFVHDRFHTTGPEMIAGIHKALLTLGGLTVVSALVFRTLRPADGDKLSRHQENAPAQHPGG
jgi:hypothetical protein